MPRGRRKAARRASDVGALSSSCDFLSHTIAAGMVLWLNDKRCGGAKRGLAVYKAHVLACARLVCSEWKDALDPLLLSLMDEVLGAVQEMRRAHLLHAPRGLTMNTPLAREGLEKGVAQAKHSGDENEANVHQSQLDFIDLVEGWMPLGVILAIRVDTIRGRPGKTCKLIPSIGSFMAVGQEQCQLHGPMGGRCASNRCRNDPWSDSLGAFTLYKMASGDEACLYCREKCLESACMFPGPSGAIFRATPPSARSVVSAAAQPSSAQKAEQLLRAMFRRRGVFHPFSTHELKAATGCWGRGAEQGEAYEQQHGPSRGTRAVQASGVPERILVQKHPQLEGETASLQQMMRLTDAEMALCQQEADNKLLQAMKREVKIRELRVQELVEDIDFYMEHDENFSSVPVRSVEKLDRACAGMAATLRMAVRRDTAVKHALDITCVRNALQNVKFFMRDVLQHEKAEQRLSSSEAYDFVSGMHVGLYTVVVHSRAQYAPINMAKHMSLGSAGESLVDVFSRAMRFFDAVTRDSLRPVRTDERSGRVEVWGVQAEGKTITVGLEDAPAGYETYRMQCERVKKLCETVCEQAADGDGDGDESEDLDMLPLRIELPPPVSQKDYERCTSRVLGYPALTKAAHKRYAEWTQQTFALLAAAPETRCAALDVIGMNSFRFVQCFLQAAPVAR